MSSCLLLGAKILLLLFAWILYTCLDKKCKNYPSTYTVKEIICHGLYFTLCCLVIFVFFLWQGEKRELPDVLKNAFVLAGCLLGIALSALQIQHEIASSHNNLNSLMIGFVILVITLSCNILSIFFYELCSNQNTERVISYLIATILFPAVIIQSVLKMFSPSSRQPKKYQVTAKPLSDQGIEPTDDEEEDSK